MNEKEIKEIVQFFILSMKISEKIKLRRRYLVFLARVQFRSQV